MTDVKESAEAEENVLLPVTLFSVTGLVWLWSVLISGAIAKGGHIDLYRLGS